MRILKSRRAVFLIIVAILVYTLVTFITQQKKLNNYEQQKQYYQSQLDELQKEQNTLKSEQTNIDSSEYIEEQAREKLDMYYPNERVYIAQ